jgi:hypothetical protein
VTEDLDAEHAAVAIEYAERIKRSAASIPHAERGLRLVVVHATAGRVFHAARADYAAHVTRQAAVVGATGEIGDWLDALDRPAPEGMVRLCVIAPGGSQFCDVAVEP